MAGKLLINRCDDCSRWIYPHRPLCPHCLSWNVTAREVSGNGRLNMFTIVYQSPDANNPHLEPMPVAAIELAEQPGLRYLSRVVNCSQDELIHDMPVKLTWFEDEGRFWPVFEPAVKPRMAHGKKYT